MALRQTVQLSVSFWRMQHCLNSFGGSCVVLYWKDHLHLNFFLFLSNSMSWLGFKRHPRQQNKGEEGWGHMNVWNLAIAVEGDVVFGGGKGELYGWLLLLVAKLTTFVSISLCSLRRRRGSEYVCIAFSAWYWQRASRRENFLLAT